MYKNIVRLALAGLTGGGLVWSQVQSPQMARDSSESANKVTTQVEHAAYFQSGDLGLPAYPGSIPQADNAPVTPPILPDQGSLSEALPPEPEPSNLQQLPPPAMPNYSQPTAQLPNRRQDNLPSSQAAFNQQQNFSQQPNHGQPNNTPFRTASNTSEGRQVLPAQLNSTPGNPRAMSGFGTNVRSTEIASGLPYVTPARRTGRYPTSAYNPAKFRNISYQAPVQQQASMQQQPSTAAIANTAPVLPQNSNVVGVAPYLANQYQANPCGAGVLPTYPAPGAVPGAYVPGTFTPNLTPGMYSPNNSGYSPIFSLGQENYNVQIGRGIVGQPTVYVPGQPFRNFLRYLSP